MEAYVKRLVGDDGIMGRHGVERALESRCAVFRSTPNRFPIAFVSSSGYGELIDLPLVFLVVGVLVRLHDLGENGERTADTRERRVLKGRGRGVGSA